MLYNFESVQDGRAYAVWGSKVLDGKMLSAEIGKVYKIEYLGKKKTEKGNREYRDFKVLEMVKS
jgi:hypothetical protein